MGRFGHVRAARPPAPRRGALLGLGLALLGASGAARAPAEAAPEAAPVAIDAQGVPTRSPKTQPDSTASTPAALPKLAAGSPVYLSLNLGDLNTTSNEANPFTRDGLTMMFDSDRPGGFGSTDIYVASRANRDSLFGLAVNLGSGVNSSGIDTQAAMTADGLNLVFVRSLGSFNSNDLYEAVRASADAPFGAAVPVSELNTTMGEGFPWISADGLTITFTSNRSGSQDNDIWTATRATRANVFGAPVRVSEFNTAFKDFSLAYRGDGLAAYLVRTPDSVGNQSNAEIYASFREKTTDVFPTPDLLRGTLDPGFDTNPHVTDDGAELYFASNRSGGRGAFDLWRVRFAPGGAATRVDLAQPVGLEGSPALSVEVAEPGALTGAAGGALAIGDFNADGIDDAVIGSPGESFVSGRAGAGAARVVFGRSVPAFSEARVFGASPTAADEWRILGKAAGAALGAATTVGDFNHDGFDDLAVSAPEESPGGFAAAGEVFVMFGSAARPGTSSDLTFPTGTLFDARIQGGAAGARMGSAMAAADVDGDGFDDLIVARKAGLPGAEVRIYYGYATLPGNLISGSQPRGVYGETTLQAPAEAGRFGAFLAAGDFNGDGYADVAVGDPEAAPLGRAGAGMVVIMPGGPALRGATFNLALAPGANGDARVYGGAPGDGAGGVAFGDVDGDGYDDALIGAPGTNSGDGQIVVLPGAAISPGVIDLGGASGAHGEARLMGGAPCAGLGRSIRAADVNADGLNDVLASARPSAASAGGEELWAARGRVGGFAAGAASFLDAGAFRLASPRAPGDDFAASVGTGGDFNQDGFGDILVSAPLGDGRLSGVAGAGYAAVIYGSGETASARAVERFARNPAPERALGGRRSSALRAWAALDSPALDPAMTLTAKLIRDPLLLKGLGAGTGLDVASSAWSLSLSRTDPLSAGLSFQYTEADVSRLAEGTLRLYQAPTSAGPWTAAPNQTIDSERRLASTRTTSLGYFALTGAAVVPARDAEEVADTIPAVMISNQRIPAAIRMRNTGSETWTEAAGYGLTATSDPCGLVGARFVGVTAAAPTESGSEREFALTLAAPAGEAVCGIEFQLTAAGVPVGGPVRGTITVGGEYRTDFANAPQEWLTGVLSGTGDSRAQSSGLCMTAPAAGDNIIAWVSPEAYLPLADMAAIVVEVAADSDQKAVDAIPLWNLIYDNFNSSGYGNNYGGEEWILDTSGGANGIGRPQGRRDFLTVVMPCAALAPQWRGLIDAAASAFSPSADDANDARLIFRVLDLDSSGVNSSADSGSVCLRSLGARVIPYSEIAATSTVWNPPISQATHAAQTLDQAAEGAGEASIDDSAGEANYALADGSGAGRRKTLVPYDPTAGDLFLSLYPVEWAGDVLYRGSFSVHARPAGLSGAEGTDPVDAIFALLDTGTNELGAGHFTTRGSPENMRFAGSPRLAATAGGDQVYVGFLYGHNATLGAAGPLANAGRLRVMADLFNTMEIAPEGVGADPLSITGLNLERVSLPAP